eukprot:COSAG04_NODE_242_length_19007_cov_3.089433_8_plen_1575_part_00
MFTQTDTHYDGGFTSTGIFAYAAISYFLYVFEDDAPDASYIATVQRCTWIDHAAYIGASVIINAGGVWPDTPAQYHAEFEDCSLTDTVNLATGDATFDGMYFIIGLDQTNTAAMTRFRFTRNGNSNPAATAPGGVGHVFVSSGSFPAPQVEYTNVEWVGNSAHSGPCGSVLQGRFVLRYRLCMFRDNVAFSSAAALSIPGLSGSTLILEASIFDGNAVRVPQDGRTTDVTVLLSAAISGLPAGIDVAAMDDVHVPIWRIDDGAVYGIPWELCEGARQYSLLQVSKGYAPSWAGLTCANVSYYQGASYSLTVPLSEGLHTLWTGTLVLVRHSSQCSAKAAITFELCAGIMGRSRLAPRIHRDQEFHGASVPCPAGPVRTFTCVLFYPFPTLTLLIRFVARRKEQFPGCTTAGACRTLGVSNCCPYGTALWSSNEFRVSSGAGGGVRTAGPIDVIICDSVLRNNEAPRGASLSITGASSLRITNTTIDEPSADSSSAVWTVASDVAICTENPCKPGSQCTFLDFSTFCEPCGENEFGADGISCDACQPGTQPNGAHTQCDPCGPGQFSQIGICIFCPSGETNSADRTGCTPCGPGTHRAYEEPACEQCPLGTHSIDGIECAVCQPGTSPGDDRDGCVACEAGKHSTSGLECSVCPAGSQPNQLKTGCDSCTLTGPSTYSPDGRGCRDCPDGHVADVDNVECQLCPPGSQRNLAKTACESCIASGENAYSPDGQACRDCQTRHAPNYERTDCFCQTDTYNAQELGLVTCRGTSFSSSGMKTDECAVCPACLDCEVVAETKLKRGWAFFGPGPPWSAYRCPGADKFEACPDLVLNDNATMDESTCAMGYEGPVCGNCAPEYNHLKVGNPCLPCDDGVINLPLVMGLAFGGMIAGGAIISGVLGVLQDNGVITDLRILVGFYQILGQASNVLDLTFPDPVPDLVDFIKLLFLDVRRVVMLDCWDIGGFYGKIVTNIVVVPTFLVSVCYLIYMSQKRTLTAVIAAGGADTSGLHALKVKLKQNLFVGIFLVYPTVTTTLFRVPQCEEFGEESFHEDDYTIDCNTTKFALTIAFAAFVILLIPIGVPVVFTLLMLRAKQANGGIVNETALGGAKLASDDADDESDTYGFLIKDYRPQYWYHEIVTYFRKLMLGGISVVMGRGSIAQTYFVITIEAFFQMHHMRTYPFVVYKHNVMEALGHCALMLLYAISLILRNDDQDTWDAEWFPKAGYGWFIVFLFAIVLPSPTVYFYCHDKDKSASEAEGFEENPLAIELGESAADDAKDDDEDQPTTKPARAKLARMQREGKDARAQVQKLQVENQQKQVENQQQQDEIQQLQDDNQQLQEEIQQLEAQGQMDGDAVRLSESALRKEVASLKAQLAEASLRGGNELVAVSDTADQAPDQAPLKKTKEAALKELAGDESLSEEARDSAMKALEVLVASQLAEIEREAAAKTRDAELKELESEQKKRAVALMDMESEVQFVESEQSVAIQKLQSASRFEQTKAQAEAEAQLNKTKAEAEVERNQADAEARVQRNVAIRKKASERLQKQEADIEEELMGWLESHRLLRHADTIVGVAGT